MFLKSTEAKIRERNKKLAKRLTKKERRLDFIGSKARGINSEISDLQAGIDMNRNNNQLFSQN